MSVIWSVVHMHDIANSILRGSKSGHDQRVVHKDSCWCIYTVQYLLMKEMIRSHVMNSREKQRGVFQQGGATMSYSTQREPLRNTTSVPVLGFKSTPIPMHKRGKCNTASRGHRRWPMVQNLRRSGWHHQISRRLVLVKHNIQFARRAPRQGNKPSLAIRTECPISWLHHAHEIPMCCLGFHCHAVWDSGKLRRLEIERKHADNVKCDLYFAICTHQRSCIRCLLIIDTDFHLLTWSWWRTARQVGEETGS